MHFLESIMCLSNLDSIVGPLSMACIPDASAGTELFPVDVIHMCIPFEANGPFKIPTYTAACAVSPPLDPWFTFATSMCSPNHPKQGLPTAQSLCRISSPN